MTIISHRYKFIFLKSRKTAGTSVEAALASQCGENDVLGISQDAVLEVGLQKRNIRIPLSQLNKKLARLYAGRIVKNVRKALSGMELEQYAFLPVVSQHMDAAAVRAYVGRDIWERYYKFTIERNPYDRLVSFYYWRRYAYGLTCSFDYFARCVLVGSDREKKAVFAKGFSNRGFYLVKDDIVVEKVILFESLEDGLREVVQEIGLDARKLAVPNLKKGIREAADYRLMYDAELANIAQKKFELEERIFGYRF